MKTIGLTGSLASGKSRAARYLAERGAHHIDADRLGHLAYEPGTAAAHAILDAFGRGVAGDDGRIDRRALGERVFGDREALERLSAIVWPEIRRLAEVRIATLRASDPDGVVVLEAAVLLEAGWEDLVDEVWVLLASPETALRRALLRDGVDEAHARRRIEAQLSNEERAKRADVVIDNDADEAHLEARLDAEWERLASDPCRGQRRAPSAGPLRTDPVAERLESTE